MIGVEGDRLQKWDSTLLIIFAILGAILAWLLVNQTGSIFFYQNFTPEPLMWACGHGFRNPLVLSPEMRDFLVSRTAPTFDCSSIPANLPTGPAGSFALTQPYFSFIAAGLWRLFGPTQIALTPLAMILAAGYSSGTYFLARMFFARSYAAAAALVLTLSPVAIGMIFNLRDYSKGPFFLWTIALLILAGRAISARKGIFLAIAAGAICGLGYCFRVDLLLLLLVGLPYLFLSSRLARLPRAVATAAYAISFIVLAVPSYVQGSGGVWGAFIAQGVTEPFRASLELRPALYVLGNAYSDELTFSAVAVSESARRPNWDAHEGKPIYGISQALTLSTSNLMEWAPYFAADFTTQALKGSAWILGYPAFVAVSRGNIDPGFALRLGVPIVNWQEPIYRLFAQPWMPLVGFIGVLALLLRIAVRHHGEALALGLLLLVLLTYPAMQFSVRHFFHLEFIWVFSVLAIACAIGEFGRISPVLPRFSAFVVVILGIISGSYFILLQLQQRWLTADFNSLLALPRVKVDFVKEPLKDGAVLLRVPIPSSYKEVSLAAPDSMTDHMAEVGNEWDVRAAGDRMLLTLGGPSCPAERVALQIVYDHHPHIWQPLDTSLAMRPRDVLIFPAFYRATQSWAGIQIPASHARCEASLSRLPSMYSLPFVMSADLPPNWRTDPLHKGFGGFDLGQIHSH